MKYSIIFYLLFFKSYAQDCNGLKENETIRLDRPDKSLEKGMVQDQDGLGTCYSNATSIILQSALKEHPDISYLNLSVQYAESVNSKHSNSTYAFDKKGYILVESGEICETIKIAKANGGVCKRTDVPLENSLFNSDIKQFSDESRVQKQLLGEMAKYYENVKNEFKNDLNKEKDKKENTENSGLKDFFSSLFSKKSNTTKLETGNIPSNAGNEVSKEKVFFGMDTHLIEKLENNLKNNIKLTKKEEYQLSLYHLLKTKMPNYFNEKCKKFDPTNGLNVINNLAALLYAEEQKKKYTPEIANLKNQIYSEVAVGHLGENTIVKFTINPHIIKGISNIYFESMISENPPSTGREAFFGMLRKVMPSTVEVRNIAFLFNKLPKSSMELLENDFQRYANNDFKECAKNKSEYFKDESGLIKDFENNECLKSYMTIGKSLKEISIGLDKKNIFDIDKVAQFAINSPDINFESSFSGLLSPNCNEENKIKIPENLNCEEKAIVFNEKNDNKEALAHDFRTNVLNSLNVDKAVGLNLCTIFFKEDPNYVYNKELKCELDRNDAYHAVTLIGAKCSKGKLEYLIQNSWGDWKLLDSKYNRDDSFGKVWFSEETLINNVYKYNIINNK